MRISAKPGQPATIKLDKRESGQLQKAMELCAVIAAHAPVEIEHAAKVAGSNIDIVLMALKEPEEATGEQS